GLRQTRRMVAVAPGPRAAEVPLPVGSPESRYLNRELSLLDYATRLLARAEDPTQPLLDRLRTLHYFARNLDDFFQIRVAGLKEQLEAAPAIASPDGRSPIAQLREIRVRVEELYQREYRLFNDEIVPQLAAEGMLLVSTGDLTRPEVEHLSRY